MNDKTIFNSDPEVLSRIDSLNISATKLVEGLLSGHHRSRHKGSSVEFAEYKDYTPGDETKHIDWKVAGKTDKYYVKQFEQSTNLKATILLDASGSMGYKSPNSIGMNKIDYARTLVAALSYLFLKQPRRQKNPRTGQRPTPDRASVPKRPQPGEGEDHGKDNTEATLGTGFGAVFALEVFMQGLFFRHFTAFS